MGKFHQKRPFLTKRWRKWAFSEKKLVKQNNDFDVNIFCFSDTSDIWTVVSFYNKKKKKVFDVKNNLFTNNTTLYNTLDIWKQRTIIYKIYNPGNVYVFVFPHP